MTNSLSGRVTPKMRSCGALIYVAVALTRLGHKDDEDGGAAVGNSSNGKIILLKKFLSL